MKCILIFILICSTAAAHSLSEAERRFPQEHSQILDIVKQDDFLEPDEYSNELKEIYFNAYKINVKKVKEGDIGDEKLPLLQAIVEGLEYKEDEVQQIMTDLEHHQKLILKRQWHKNFEATISLVSFQRHIDLSSPSRTQKLISTSKASCLGGGLSFKNSFWSLTSHGCVLFGNSNIKEKKATPLYKESSVPLWGAKITQRAGMIVSSSGSELGLSLPIILYYSDLKNPSGNYKVKDDKKFTVAPALYGKWALGKLFLDTEIGQFIDQSNTYYSIGLGFKF